MKWIMFANSNDCRIYAYDQHKKHLTLIDEICHPENKLKVHDWVTDHPGHFQSCGTHHGSFEPENSPVDTAIDGLARDMAERLNKGRVDHAFDDLILIMAPRMEGLLNKHLNKETRDCVTKVIQKNLMFKNEHEVKDYLNKLFVSTQHE